MSAMLDRPAPDFYEAQAFRRRTSLILFGILVVLATAAFSAAFGALRIVIAAFGGRPLGFRPSTAAGILALGAIAALLLVGLQYLDSRWNGTAYILKRLNARTPDLRDRNHRLAFEVVERIRIAAGLLGAETKIIPDHTMNALALAGRGGRRSSG